MAGYYIVAFICGAVLMALEILGSRIMAPFFGTSVFVWGALITIILAALSIGYSLGGRIADRRPEDRLLARIILSSSLLILLLVFFSKPIAGFIQTVIPDIRYAPLVAAGLLFTLPAILLGMVSPFAIRLAARDIESIGSLAGHLYAVSTLGSIVGTLMATFFLLPSFPVAANLLGLGLTLVLVTHVLASQRRILSFLISVVLIGGTLGIYHLRSGHEVTEGDFKRIYSRDSAYHHIEVLDNGQQRMMRFDNLIQGLVSTTPPYPSKTTYTDYMQLGFVFNRETRSVLIIGLGAGIMPREFRALDPELMIDVVEIDPAVEDVARKFFYFHPHPLTRVTIADGRTFLQNTGEKYDFIVVDAFLADSIPFHLMTVEFFHVVKDHLNHEGCMAMNLLVGNRKFSDELLSATVKTLQEVFPQIYLFPVGDFTPGGVGNVLVVADTKMYRIPKDTLKARALAFREKTGTPYPLDSYAEKMFTDELHLSEAPIFRDDKSSAEVLRMLSILGEGIPISQTTP
ncbi:MAG TPA: fused MFS/spermidine synthase [Thermoanaerobaculia bacterium]|nr:fused MFS/spermidine synthase [Thermoanaerobaculia bacterium]HUM29061.1 fused MFS/spermidine synthase [Thermoanaerobaculia bacterium]HXK67383.1 fused MFS/spermidine synthase [Thermoanaerobaculia bacterium]